MNQNFITLQQPVSKWNQPIKLGFKDLFTGLGKMAIAGIMLDGKAVAFTAMDLLKTAGLQDKPEQLAWVLIYQALVCSLTALVHEYENIFVHELDDAQLEAIARQLETALNALEVHIDAGFF